MRPRAAWPLCRHPRDDRFPIRASRLAHLKGFLEAVGDLLVNDVEATPPVSLIVQLLLKLVIGLLLFQLELLLGHAHAPLLVLQVLLFLRGARLTLVRLLDRVRKFLGKGCDEFRQLDRAGGLHDFLSRSAVLGELARREGDDARKLLCVLARLLQLLQAVLVSRERVQSQRERVLQRRVVARCCGPAGVIVACLLVLYLGIAVQSGLELAADHLQRSRQHLLRVAVARVNVARVLRDLGVVNVTLLVAGRDAEPELGHFVERLHGDDVHRRVRIPHLASLLLRAEGTEPVERLAACFLLRVHGIWARSRHHQLDERLFAVGGLAGGVLPFELRRRRQGAPVVVA
eukprot:1084768-Prymnesium_polylepis.1